MVKPNQVWASKGNESIQRIILQVTDGILNSSKQSAFYVEYWRDQDLMHKEGLCGVNHLRSWGDMIQENVDPKLQNRALEFLIQDRFSRAQLMLNDLASVITEPRDRMEVLAMIDRIDTMSSHD